GTHDWLDRTDAGAAAGVNGVQWSEERQELTLFPQPFQYKAAKNDRAPSVSDRRGAERDRYGNWFWIDASATPTMARSAGTALTSRFWQVGEGACGRVSAASGEFAPVVAEARAP